MSCDIGEVMKSLENDLQSFFRFSYVTGSSLMSPGEPPMIMCMLSAQFVEEHSSYRLIKKSNFVKYALSVSCNSFVHQLIK